jgi:hypothetical protein
MFKALFIIHYLIFCLAFIINLIKPQEVSQMTVLSTIMVSLASGVFAILEKLDKLKK